RNPAAVLRHDGRDDPGGSGTRDRSAEGNARRRRARPGHRLHGRAQRDAKGVARDEGSAAAWTIVNDDPSMAWRPSAETTVNRSACAPGASRPAANETANPDRRYAGSRSAAATSGRSSSSSAGITSRPPSITTNTAAGHRRAIGSTAHPLSHTAASLPTRIGRAAWIGRLLRRPRYINAE